MRQNKAFFLPTAVDLSSPAAMETGFLGRRWMPASLHCVWKLVRVYVHVLSTDLHNSIDSTVRNWIDGEYLLLFLSSTSFITQAITDRT